jgi:PAS domain S-box-containing protein
VNKQFAEKWQRRLGSSYEIRIRVTLGLMFLLIIVANLNSLRFFSASKSLQNSTVKSRAVENMTLMSRLLKTNSLERSRSSQFRDLAQTAGFSDIAVVETELLQHDESDSSGFVDANALTRLRTAYNQDKELAGAVGGGLPATLSAVYTNDRGEKVRTAAYHFTADDGKALSLIATVPADIEVGLQRFSTLNMVFQLVSMAAAITIAVSLLRIMLKPYRLIKSQALQADVAGADQPESVDFAVQTFQKVISELRTKEAVLQRLYAQQKDRATSLERYNEYILAGMSSAVISCDRDGAITHFNRAAESICGLQAASVISQEYHYVLADFPMFANLIGDAIEIGRETTLPEVEMHLTDGGSRWLSVTCSQLRDDAGNPRGVMLLISDLTDLKRLESEVRVKEQMAALGEMAAGLAHQLRNSLAAVVGFAQLLQKMTSGVDKAPSLVANIITEAKATEEMLTRFLKLSRTEEICLQSVELSEIQEIVENHFSEQSSARTRLRFAVDDDLTSATCDPIIVANVLINLVQNAFEASAADGQVRVEMHSRDHGQVLEFQVSDRGKGIPAQEIPKIFLPFYTSGKATGTGLGLSLVRKWVLYHNGEITCESTPGIGTKFTVRLPQRIDTAHSQRISCPSC